MKIIKLHNAAKNDCRDLWLWRNDLRIRSNFFDTNKVSWNRHKKWFCSNINNPRTNIYIAYLGGDKIGVIRFDDKGSHVKVSVNLNPVFLGKGLGVNIIKLGTKKFLKGIKINKSIVAEIKKNNLASQKAFRKAGYILLKKRKDMLVLHKSV